IMATIPGAAVTCRSAGLPDNCVYNNTKEFQPRVGFAWQITPKTVIRGGAGAFYGHDLGFHETEEGSDSWPFLPQPQTQTFSAPPTSGPPPLTLSNLGGLTNPPPFLTGTPSDQPDPSTKQWNFTVEREVMANTIVTASYVGVVGQHLEG